MSFPVAVQSAIFYFLSCTPCYEIHNRHKARQQAKKERVVKERIVIEQPHLYQHPDPFHTNPYWDEEIRMGPSLPKKRKGIDGISKSLSQRRLTAASRDGRPSIGTGSSVLVNMSEMGSIASPRPSTSPVSVPGMGSAPTVVPEEYPASPTLSKTVSISTSADWNMKRYQREDEELWGHDSTWSGHKLMDAIKQAGSSAGRFVESKLSREKPVTEEDRYNFYFAPRNPPVNDYHPPVVSSKPAHKDALRWMLQPPPPAKIMEGKIPVTRSASTMTAASRRTIATRDGGSLGRLVGEKAVEAKIRRGETPLDEELRPTSSLSKTRSRPSTAARTRSRRTTRTFDSSSDTEADSEEWSHRRKRRSHRPVEAETDDEDEGVSIPKSPEASTGNGLLTIHAAQKPRLPTIPSSGYEEKVAPDWEKDEPPKPLRVISNSKSEPDMSRIKAKPAITVTTTTVATPIPA